MTRQAATRSSWNAQLVPARRGRQAAGVGAGIGIGTATAHILAHQECCCDHSAAACATLSAAQARNLFKRKMEAAAREVSELAQRVAVANGWVRPGVKVHCRLACWSQKQPCDSQLLTTAVCMHSMQALPAVAGRR